MAGALLRSGSLRDFHPLGAVGNPVFSAASQLRAAVRRLIGGDIADLFAIPRPHDSGDTIDWYAPEPGEVIPWSAATVEQREAARVTLQAARVRLAEHSRSLQAHDSSERQVFGRLLELATQIPSEDHIYIVGGRPVLTFWGFHPLSAPTELDVIGALGAAERTPQPLPGAPVPPVAKTTAPLAGETPIATASRRWWWLLLPLLLLLLLLMFLLMRACPDTAPQLPGALFGGATRTPNVSAGATPGVVDVRHAVGHAGDTTSSAGETGGEAEPGAGAPAAAATSAAAAESSPPANELPESAPPVGKPSPPQPDTAETPATARTAPRPDAQPSAGKSPPSAPSPPAPALASRPGEPSMSGQRPAGAPLTIPDEAVRENSTDFLNGQWRSITGLQDRTGNPVELSYDFKNGEGTVSLHRSVGNKQETCSGHVGSTLRDGALVIGQSGVRCPDGSAFQDAKVQCTVGAGGKAVCRGVNSDGTTYDVNIVK